jgi:hypothetical protein
MFATGETRRIGFTTQGGVILVKALDVPEGWTVGISRSGAAGTFTVTAPATLLPGIFDALILAADAGGKSVIRPLPLFTFATAGTHTWTFGSSTLTWSDAIHIPECNKDDFSNSDTEPRCRSYTEGGHTWYYYNWPYVIANPSLLCPSPWRVPTKSDFEALQGATDGATLTSSWGYGGCANGSSMEFVGSLADYWSSTEYNSSYAYYMYYYNTYLSVTSRLKYYGSQVRCVK